MALAKKLTSWSPKLIQTEQPSPEVGYVQIGELHYDYLRWEKGQAIGYQRALDEARVAKYEENYDPHLLRPVVVNRRADGSLWVIDGQHTVALERSLGKAVVMATVWNGLTPEEEAAQFNGLNSKRVTPNQWTRFGARASASEPKVLAIIALARECGFKIGTADRSTNSIAAVSALESIYDASPRLLRDTLSAIRRVWPADVLTRDGVFIRGLASFIFTWDESYFPTMSGLSGNVLNWPRFDDRLTRVTGRELMQDVKKLRVEEGMAFNPASYAIAIRERYNGRTTFRERLEGRPVSPSSGKRTAITKKR